MTAGNGPFDFAQGTFSGKAVSHERAGAHCRRVEWLADSAVVAPLARGVRFVAAGAAGFVTQLALLAALTTAGLPVSAATAIAVEAAILVNFIWHERWTWRDRTAADGRLLVRLGKFNGVTGLVSIGGNVALTAACHHGLHLPLIAANVLAVAMLAAVNFTIADRLVFATQSSAADRAG